MYIIHTDGIEAGDYNEGMALCYKTLALQAVDPNVKPEPDCINLVYEHTISSQTDRTFMNLQEIFKRIESESTVALSAQNQWRTSIIF